MPVDRVLLEGQPGSSGRNSSARPVRTTNHSATEGTGTMTMLSSSSRIRSADTMERRWCPVRTASTSSGVGSRLSLAMNLAALSIRRGSSAKDTSGSSGVDSRCAERSARPPNGSTISSSGSRRAMALMVKSRRARSSSTVSPNATSGLRESGR